MSPAQLEKLQELSQTFSQGEANPQQIQQLSALLAQINKYESEQRFEDINETDFIAAPKFG